MSAGYGHVRSTTAYFVGLPIDALPGQYACASPRTEHELEALAMLEQHSDPRAVLVRDVVTRSVRGRS
jgi:hypothetical protein